MMSETEMRAPKFNELTAAGLSDSNDVKLQFLAVDGQRYGIEIARPIVGSTIAAIVGELNKVPIATLDPAKRGGEFSSLRLTGVRPMVTADGGPALALVFENAFELGVELPPGAADGLRTALHQAEKAGVSSGSGPKH